MAYILVVILLSSAQQEWILAAMFGNCAGSDYCGSYMAFFANLPIALASGMGLNAYFAYGVCIGMGYTWQFALTAVFGGRHYLHAADFGQYPRGD